MTINCSQVVRDFGQSTPNRLAMWSFERGALSYQEFCAEVSRAQKILNRSKFSGGQTLFVFSQPSIETYLYVIGVLGMGGRVLFVEPWLKESQQILRRLNPKFVLVDRVTEVVARLRGYIRSEMKVIRISDLAKESLPSSSMIVESVAADEPALITFTSGSTGSAKGVVRSHDYANRLRTLLSKGDTDDTSPHPDLSVIGSIPLMHLGTGRGAILVGTQWTNRRFKVLSKVCEQLRPSTLSCAPAFLNQLLKVPGFESLKKIYIGGASADIGLMEQAFARWRQTEFVHIYGSTEIEPISICDARIAVERSRQKGFSQMLFLGHPIEGVRSRIEEDVLWVSADNLCSKNIDWQHTMDVDHLAFTPEVLWHCTGDRVLAEGEDLFYAGRANLRKDLFIREQAVYQAVGHSRCFLHANHSGQEIVFGEDLPPSVSVTCDGKTTNYETAATHVVRDRRHRSRLDRIKSRQPEAWLRRWQVFFRERSPFAGIAFIATGPALVPQFLSEGHFSGVAFLLSSLFIFLALIVMRLNDEIKDYSKDVIAHPARPLPRGLVTLNEAKSVARVLMVSLVGLAAVAYHYNPTAGLCAGAVVLWCHLIRKGFYAEGFFGRHLLFSTVVHQLLVFPLYMLPFSLMGLFHHTFSSWFTMAAFSASMLYELTRKMGDAKTEFETNYLRTYGLSVSTIAVSLCSAVYLFSLSMMGLHSLAWVMMFVLCIPTVRFALNAARIRPLAGGVALANVVVLWSVPVAHGIQRLLGGE